MKTFVSTCAAVALTMGLAGTANAAINVNVAPGGVVYTGPTPTYDFDTLATTPNTLGTGVIDNTSVGGIRAQPMGSTGYYYAVGPSGNGVQPGLIDFSSFGDIYNLSFIWGSVDDYNLLEFLDAGLNVIATFDGANFLPANGCQNCPESNPLVTFFLDGGDESDFAFLRLTSEGQNAFEVDNFAVNAVPEPATWAMMLLGFAGIGMAMRRRRSAIPQLA